LPFTGCLSQAVAELYTVNFGHKLPFPKNKNGDPKVATIM
jgi:hypothetical protein